MYFGLVDNAKGQKCTIVGKASYSSVAKGEFCPPYSNRAGPVKAEETMPSIDQFIVWIIVGLLGGSLAGLLSTWERRGFGLYRNVAVGLAGALIGGLLFRMLGLFPGLDKISISLRDVVAAFVGSLIVLIALWLWQQFNKS
jgi:uncharacterized membrane protein YeaQ/YmgE (transglycosylase-associated protein family)